MGTLKLQTNVPQIIALQFAEGLTVQSNYGGDQVMFTLTNGEKWYAAPIIAKKIKDARIRPGQPFEVCKREVVNGNRRMIEYQITPVESAAGLPRSAASAVNTASSTTSASTTTSLATHNNSVAAPLPTKNRIARDGVCERQNRGGRTHGSRNASGSAFDRGAVQRENVLGY